MSPYEIRSATLEDLDTLVAHRLAMFEAVGSSYDAASVGPAFRAWAAQMMRADQYHAWLAASRADGVVGGGGLTILPWPPGPSYVGGRIAFVYNVYVAPSHRRRGVARLIMRTIHDWCARNGIGLVGLNASEEGRPLYDSLGYRPATSPLLFAAVDAGPPAGRVPNHA